MNQYIVLILIPPPFNLRKNTFRYKAQSLADLASRLGAHRFEVIDANTTRLFFDNDATAVRVLTGGRQSRQLNEAVVRGECDFIALLDGAV